MISMDSKYRHRDVKIRIFIIYMLLSAVLEYQFRIAQELQLAFSEKYNKINLSMHFLSFHWEYHIHNNRFSLTSSLNIAHLVPRQYFRSNSTHLSKVTWVGLVS